MGDLIVLVSDHCLSFYFADSLSSLALLGKLKDPRLLHADNENSDQTEQMRRLI